MSESDEEEPGFRKTHDPGYYLTGECGAIESLFTPEGIEFVNAARNAPQRERPSRASKRKPTRS